MGSKNPPTTRPTSSTAYQNGSWVDAGELSVSVRDAAFVQAVTAVERMRSYQGKLFELPRYLARWERTVAELKLSGVPSRDSLTEILTALVARNREWIGDDEYGVTLVASPGRGIGQETLIAELTRIDAELTRQRLRGGTPLVITSVQQPPSESWSRRIKVRCRLHYYLADRQAQSIDSTAMGVLVDSDGTITETGIANVLIVDAGEIVSPPDDQILPGVTLSIVKELAIDLGMTVTEQRISPERLREADEVLLTGTTSGLWWACSVDGNVRQPGEVFARLRAAFDQFTQRT